VTHELARPVAVALIRRGNEVLLFEVPDPIKGVTGWRSPNSALARRYIRTVCWS
jgi:hypothetical protein